MAVPLGTVRVGGSFRRNDRVPLMVVFGENVRAMMFSGAGLNIEIGRDAVGVEPTRP